MVCALTALCAPLIADLFAEPRATPIIQALALLPLAWILVDLYGFIGVGYAYVIALAMSQALGVLFIERMLETPSVESWPFYRPSPRLQPQRAYWRPWF